MAKRKITGGTRWNEETYRQMRADDIEAGRESEIGQNVWRAIQGLPLLDPAGSSDSSVLKATFLLCAAVGAIWCVIYLLV